MVHVHTSTVDVLGKTPDTTLMTVATPAPTTAISLLTNDAPCTTIDASFLIAGTPIPPKRTPSPTSRTLI